MDIATVISRLETLKSNVTDTKAIDDAIKVIEVLQHEYITTRGLWCIDQDPAEVDYQWIRQNAFRLSSLPNLRS